mgnify:CR=1 FL=1
MKTFTKLAAVSLVALMATGCSNKWQSETDTRVSANEEAAARAQARADEAYTRATEALNTAKQAQRSADEANERANRMLERASRK